MARHKGSCCRDILERHVAETKACVVHTEVTFSRDVWQANVAGTKSQHLQTHENVAEHVPGYVEATWNIL